ncbi:hypothetical protein WA158_006829 [Blastocystis sp. Blastoise]
MSEIKIALEIVRENYGPLAEKMCKFMTRFGSVTYGGIIKEMQKETKQKATIQNITDCLVGLILHKIVIFNIDSESDEKLIQSKYKFSPIGALYRLRLGSYITFIQDKFGEIGGMLMTEYAVRGAAITRDVLDSICVTGDEHTYTREELKNTLDALKSQGYICTFIDVAGKKKQMRDHLLALQRIASVTKRKGRGRPAKVPAKPKVLSPTTPTSPVSPTESAPTRGKKRKTATLAELYLGTGNTNTPESELSKRLKVEKSPKDTEEDTLFDTKEGEGEEEEDHEDVDMRDKLFCINYEIYAKILRNNMIVKYVTERINKTAGIIMDTILTSVNIVSSSLNSTNSDQYGKPLEVSASFTARQIFDRLNDSVPVSFNLFVNYMKDLASTRMGCLDTMLACEDSSDITGGTYVIAVYNVMNKIKEETVGAYIERRLSPLCARIWRVLLKYKKLDEQQLSTISMIPLKITRSCIVLLQNDRFVTLQEIPKKSDHQPNSTFYLWGIDLTVITRSLLDICYNCLLNIKMKERNVVANNAGLYDLFARKLLSAKEKERIVEIEESVRTMNYSCITLDGMVALLRDM